MKVHLYGGPGNGQEANVPIPAPPNVFWLEPVRAEGVAENTPKPVLSLPVHRYERTPWHSPDGLVDGWRYEYAATMTTEHDALVEERK